jgi:3-hydroxybutyryl-CoA dehydratase
MAIEQKYFLEDMKLGMSGSTTMIVTGEKIDNFADVIGDYNPLHMDAEYAKETMFGRRIAHGALAASLISNVIGNDLPGPGAVFVELNLRFRRPVFIDDEVTAVAEVSEINEKTGRIRMKCYCLVGGKQVCRGDAGVVVSKRPKDDS